MPQNKYNTGIIGNCAYLAHIDTKANVKWLCWPQFDSSFVFGELIDSQTGGAFSILPTVEGFSTVQTYVENTNVICTEFNTSSGNFKVTDFAPRFKQHGRYHRPLMLIRKIERISGNPQIIVTCDPSYEYGKAAIASHLGSNHIRYSGLPDQLRLTTNIPVNFIDKQISFQLFDTKYLVLTYGTPLEAEIIETCETFLKNTINYWRSWVKASSYPMLYQKEIIRSALALKIHQYEQTGAIIAASTTSLPEFQNMGRNWDYRFCWLRDAYYTLTAFNHIGHFEELEGYFQYISNITAKHPNRLQPLFTINCESELTETVLDLDGYLGSNKPVRIGNDAYNQIQNDGYGQVLVSLLPLYIDKRFIDTERSSSLLTIHNLLKMIEETMQEPDAGIWEFRESRQLHGYTFLFHWAGAKAAIKILKTLNADEEWIVKAEKIASKASEMIEKCFDAERGVYTQAIGSIHLDASMLQLITMGYLDGEPQKALKHLRVMEQELKSDKGMFYRYKHHDDFGIPETTFVICSFWYVESLARLGLVNEAMENFNELLKYGNHLGLLSEHINSNDGSQWGNFPQTYSHVGLINAAYQITRKLNKPNFLV